MPHLTSKELSNQDYSLVPNAPVDDDENEIHDKGSSDSGDPLILPDDAVKDPAKIEVKLEDLFNTDDEDDDEFPSSRPTGENIPSSPPVAPVQGYPR